MHFPFYLCNANSNSYTINRHNTQKDCERSIILKHHGARARVTMRLTRYWSRSCWVGALGALAFASLLMHYRLMAATWAARCGLNTRIVDKRGSQIFNGQADGLQCRTLEIFESFGLVERILKFCCPVLEICFWVCFCTLFEEAFLRTMVESRCV